MSDLPSAPPEEDPYSPDGEVTTEATLPRHRLHIYTAYRRALGLLAAHPLLFGTSLLAGAAGGVLGMLARSPVASLPVAGLAGVVAAAVLVWTWALTYRYVAVDYREVDPSLSVQARVALRRLPATAAATAVVFVAGSVPVAAVAAVGGAVATAVLGLTTGLAAAGAIALAVPAVAVDGRDLRDAFENAVDHAREAWLLTAGILAVTTVPVLAFAVWVATAHGRTYVVIAGVDGLVATLGHLALGHAYVELEAL